jgi:hypothetical protein
MKKTKLSRAWQFLKNFPLEVILAVSLILAPGTAAGASANLLPNGGFEAIGEQNLPLGWQVIPAYQDKGQARMDNTLKHSGAYSLRLTPNQKNNIEGYGIFQMLDKNQIQGQKVTISGYARMSGLGDNPAAIFLYTDRANWVVIPKVKENEFVFFSKSFTMSPSIPVAGLLLMVGGTSGDVWFDDLSISTEAATIPTTTAPEPSVDDRINKINTEGWVDSAFISPDGRELYFAYMPYCEMDFMDIIFGRKTEAEITEKGPIRPGEQSTMQFETYVAMKKADGTWGQPQRLNINSPDYSLYAAKLSLDGTELYYAIRDWNKNYGNDDIYVSRRLGDTTWSPPENLGPNINSTVREDTPCLSPDGQTLYFARNSISESLGWEIWMSQKVDGYWSQAEKLDPPINELDSQNSANFQAFITADGQEFYFTRIMNLYRSKKQGDGSWGEPEKIFPGVAGHASVTADGRYLYFIGPKDDQDLQRHHWTVFVSEKQSDGAWGSPQPVD